MPRLGGKNSGSVSKIRQQNKKKVKGTVEKTLGGGRSHRGWGGQGRLPATGDW